ncbi:MAG: AI-2E family transporter [Roseivivax sp.]|nr:AI-2E family transporter [Roseivivax sp.]
MAYSVGQQVRYWSIAAVVFAVVLYALGNVLLPFVLGGAIAYFLDPVADRLERMGLSRGAATAVITVVAMVVFVVMALLIVPLLVQQSIQLFETVPEMSKNFQTFLTERFPSIMVEDSVLRQSLASLGETVRQRGGQLLEALLSSAAGIINIVTLFVIVPVVAVYLLVDWDNMIARIDDLLPRDHAPVIRRLALEIDGVLSSFVRGMGSVCLILGTYYALALWLVGLQFGLVIGVVAGLLTFIPYVGAIVGGLLAIGIALFQFWGDWVWVAAVWAVFQSGQLVEGNYLTPKLVGGSVGLHPVWLLLALSVFGALFGFVGLLVAVPMAAALGVIARFAINQYKDGRLYRGLSGGSGR